MSKKQITSGQMQALVVLFLHGSSSLVSVTSKAKQDTWFTIILAGMMAIPLTTLYSAIVKKYPQKNLFEIINEVFGKTIGKVVCILYIWYAIYLGSMNLRMFTEFMHLLTLSETPQIVISLFMILLCIFSVTCGIENMGRMAKISFVAVGVFIITTTVVSMKDMNFNNIKPVFFTDAATLIASSFPTLMLPFGELVLIIALFPFVKSTGSPTKIYVKSVLISTILLVILNLRNLFVLGPSAKMFYLTSYQAVSVISIGDFFTRMEVLVGAIIILSCFMKICICLLISSIGIANICNIPKNKQMIAPCGLIMVTLATVLYTKIDEMIKWVDMYMVYVIPFELIFPAILWIAIKWKPKNGKNTVLSDPEKIGSLE